MSAHDEDPTAEPDPVWIEQWHDTALLYFDEIDPDGTWVLGVDREAERIPACFQPEDWRLECATSELDDLEQFI